MRGVNQSIPPKGGFNFGQLRSELALRGDSDFLGRHTVPALVARQGLVAPGAQPAAFVTRWARPDQLQAEDESDDQEVFFIAKKPGAPFPDRIGVGRAPNVDIVVRRDGISKYHAYFVPISNDEYQLADAGSKNGTYIEQRKLTDRTPVRVQDGDIVRFGTEAFVFVLPSSLLELLRDPSR